MNNEKENNEIVEEIIADIEGVGNLETAASDAFPEIHKSQSERKYNAETPRSQESSVSFTVETPLGNIRVNLEEYENAKKRS